MKYRFCVFVVCLLIPLFAHSDEDKYVVGCWTAEIGEYENMVTLCANHKVGSISTYYSNKRIESDPTRCYQSAYIEYKSEEIILLSGAGGFCDNGRDQGEVTIMCELKSSKAINCDVYGEYREINAKELIRLK